MGLVIIPSPRFRFAIAFCSTIRNYLLLLSFFPPKVALATKTLGATIYYTLDGSTPSPRSTVYSAPIPVTTTTVVRALAAKVSLRSLMVASLVYAAVSDDLFLATQLVSRVIFYCACRLHSTSLIFQSLSSFSCPDWLELHQY